MENGNGSNKKSEEEEEEVMEVEDLETDQPSWIGASTPSDSEAEPPAKCPRTDETDGGGEGEEEEVKGDDSVAVAVDCDVENTTEPIEKLDPSDTDELLPRDMPKAYNLFATCVSTVQCQVT